MLKYGVVLIHGFPVEIIKNHYNFDEIDKYFYTVLVKKLNGQKLEIDCRDMLFKYNSLD